MTEHGIIFNTEMVQAIHDGKKTQTRRVGDRYKNWKAGDRLYVREAFYQSPMTGAIRYKADGFVKGWRPRPSIHLPKALSRIWLEITDIRRERVQDITLGDICKEGLADSIYDFKPAQKGFIAWQQLWDSINAKRGYGWDKNPIVRVITFSGG